MTKKILSWAGLAVVAMLMLTGCAYCSRPAVVVQVETNETAVLVDMRATDAVAIEGSVDSRRDIRIASYWVQTGLHRHTGHQRPTHRVMIVSRRPVELSWDGRGGRNVARVVSAESAGFSIPLTINAMIANDADAVQYLRYFQAENLGPDETAHGVRHWRVREEAQPLENALNTMIFPAVLNSLTANFQTVPIVQTEQSRVRFVNEALAVAQAVGREFGITILNLTSTDGLIFDDESFQTAINDLAVLGMRENVLQGEWTKWMQYDEEFRALTVWFKSGHEEQYVNVTPEMAIAAYKGVTAKDGRANSTGAWLHQNLIKKT